MIISVRRDYTVNDYKLIVERVTKLPPNQITCTTSTLECCTTSYSAGRLLEDADYNPKFIPLPRGFDLRFDFDLGRYIFNPGNGSRYPDEERWYLDDFYVVRRNYQFSDSLILVNCNSGNTLYIHKM